MGKKGIMITLDEETLSHSKELGINLSGTLNRLLLDYFKIKPEEIEEQIGEVEKEALEEKEKKEKEYNDIYQLAKEFWASDIGKEVLRRSRERYQNVLEDKDA